MPPFYETPTRQKPCNFRQFRAVGPPIERFKSNPSGKMMNPWGKRPKKAGEMPLNATNLGKDVSGLGKPPGPFYKE
jgi:hypothetical protein